MPDSDEHRLGALLIAVASASAGNYVLIRTGMTRRKPKVRQWRVSIRLSHWDPSPTVTSGQTLRDALERALLRLGGDVSA